MPMLTRALPGRFHPEALLAGAREVGGVMAVMAPTGAGDGAGVESIIAAAKSIKVPPTEAPNDHTVLAAFNRLSKTVVLNP